MSKTRSPERLICQMARGDMYSDYIGDTEYRELMEPVSYSEEDLEAAIRLKHDGKPEYQPTPAEVEENGNTFLLTEAKTRAFLRKEANRGHWGIWEHPSITFAVKNMSVVTERQLTRHRHLTFDIQSMRYVDFQDDKPYAMPVSLTDIEHSTRGEGMIWKDMESDVPLEEQDGDIESMEKARKLYYKGLDNASTVYNNMRELGVPKEDARYILPLGTQINVGMSGNGRTFLHVLNLRQRGDSQWEIRDLSEMIVAELREWMPYTAEWWDEKGPVQISP